jgi:tetratricopeptide (TPR) repeat protein
LPSETALQRAYATRAGLYAAFGMPAKAIADFRRVLELHEKAAAEITQSAAYRNELAGTLAYLGVALENDGRRAEAEGPYRQAVTVWQQLSDEFPDNQWYRHERAYFSIALARILQSAGQFEAALEHCRTSVRLNERLVADFANAARLAQGRGMLIALLSSLGRDEEAGNEVQTLLKGSPSPEELNNVAWGLIRRSDPSVGVARQAVELAQKAVDLSPSAGHIWNTLGVAHYRAGSWPAAIEALEKSRELNKDKHLSVDAFFLAMAHWQLGNKDEARKWFDQGALWMEKNQPQNEDLRRFRAEAEKLLEIKEQQD